MPARSACSPATPSSDVFPIPASPSIATKRPWPPRAA